MTQMTHPSLPTRFFPSTPISGPHLSSRGRRSDRYWPVLRDLIEARSLFDLRRPVLATLRALISFIEDSDVVFASNRSIAARAEGVSESALRRHIKSLIDCGLLIRRDSSNGKRYRIEAEGQPDIIYGLDLSPLEAAATRIATAAAQCREENRLIRYFKKRLGQLMFLARAGGQDDTAMQGYQTALRRKLSAADFAELCRKIEAEIPNIPRPELLQIAAVDPAKTADTAEMTGSDIQSDCHKNITNKRLLNLEGDETQIDPGSVEKITKNDETGSEIQASPLARQSHAQKPSKPMDSGAETFLSRAPADDSDLLRKARSLVPDALAFADHPLRSWQDTEHLAWRLALWNGIPPHLLQTAIHHAGQRLAAMAILTITQNAGRIRNPAAYFRTLTLGRHFERFARPLSHPV